MLKDAAGGPVSYRARKESKELGYGFDKLPVEFSLDLFGSDVCLCVCCVTINELSLAFFAACHSQSQ